MYMEFCSFGHRLLDRDLLPPKLKVHPTIMYVNNIASLFTRVNFV